MNYSVLLLNNNWVFIQNKNSISLKHRNVLIADTINDYIELMSQLAIYRYEKSKANGKRCFIKIQNTNTNITIVIREHEVDKVYDFLMSIRKHIVFVKKHTQVKNSVFQLS
tara:strand:+ start:1388 stop:1720 length:333 start_codon:yes stop_codon:yes gene_type:complete